MRQPEPGYRQQPGTTRTLERAAGDRLVRRTLLPNGLRVITEQMPGTQSASVGLWVGVGSRDEQLSVAGAAHYLEHLLFKGTARRSAARIAEEMDAVGGELNAFTAKEHTCFYAHVLDGDLPLAVDLLTDVVFDATLDESDMEIERGVVLEEIAMRDDDPEDLLHETFCAALFGDHPLGRSVLGTEESVTGMSRNALRGFHRRRFTCEKMVLAVTGNITHAQVLRLVRKNIERTRVGGAERAPVPPRRGRARIPRGERLVLHSDDTEQAHLMLGMRGLDRYDERRYALGVLSAALGGGMSSRLFQEVRERRGLAYQVYSAQTGYADTGYFTVYAGCQPNRLGDVTSVVRKVLVEVADGGLDAAEVARGKGQLRGGLVLGLEDNGSRMSRLGKAELTRGEYRSLDTTLADIDAVTEEDVAALARELLGRPATVAVVGPYARPDELPAELHEVIA
jgi:predicted Zn-dependent peptidase